VEWSQTLAPATWVPLADRVAGTGLPISIEDPTATNEGQRFYRVILLPQAGSSGPPGFLQAAEAHAAGVATLSVPLLSAGDNRAMVVALCWYDESSREVSSLTYAGEACSPLLITNWFNGSGRLALYFLPAPDAGSNTLQVTMSGITAELSLAAMVITNANQPEAVGAVAANYSSTLRDSVTIALASNVNDLVVDVLGFYTADHLPGLGQTLRILANNDGNASVMMSTKTGEVSLTTMSWFSDEATQISEVGVSIHGF